MGSRCGKLNECANVHVQNMISFQHFSIINLYQIHEFTNKLLGSVQTLKGMGKLKEIKGYVGLNLDKLQGIRSGLARMDTGWHEWKFPQLVEAIESWAQRNSITLRENNPEIFQSKSVQTNWTIS